jgi:hypothetical protein
MLIDAAAHVSLSTALDSMAPTRDIVRHCMHRLHEKTRLVAPRLACGQCRLRSLAWQARTTAAAHDAANASSNCASGYHRIEIETGDMM